MTVLVFALAFVLLVAVTYFDAARFRDTGSRLSAAGYLTYLKVRQLQLDHGAAGECQPELLPLEQAGGTGC